MPAMCEGCKDSIPLRDTYCAECKQEASEVRNRLAEREAQALEIAGKDRDEVSDEHPIIYAQSGPCRYQSITYWFPEEDGVMVQQSLDNEEEITVKYLTGEEEIDLTEGALYDWALEQFYND